jgi:CBS domain-containing protein
MPQSANLRIPPIKEYMIEHPYSIQVTETARSAEMLMSAHKIRHLPVLDGKEVIGIISDRDISLAKVVNQNQAYYGQVKIKEVCLFDSCIFDENEPLDVVAKTMAMRRIDAVVITAKDVPVGIFTTTDACRLLAELFKSHKEDRGLISKLFGI